jgi:ATP-dependent Clp protease ATP-binding subunit ClpA
MTTIQTNNENLLLSSFTTSHLEYFENSLATATASSLLEELNNEDALLDSTLLKVVAFLADSPHTQLEKALKEKIAKADSSETLSNVRSVSSFSFLANRLKMLEVCKKIVSLDQLKKGLDIKNAMAIAKRESSIIPAPTRTIQKISNTASQNWNKYSSIFGKAVHWLHTVIFGILSTTGTTLLSPILNPPSSMMTMQGYFSNYSTIINTFIYLATSYLAFFTTMKKAALVGAAILTAVISIDYFDKQFRLGIPEQIDKIGIFKNITVEAQNNKIKKMKGRLVEKEQVKTAWNVAPTEKFRIALLVGSPGCGKTEFVKGLAWESVNDPDSFVYGKKIYMANTNTLAKEGTHYLNKVLADLEGYEDDVVLFFDEGHSAGGQAGQTGTLIESLKTTLLEKNIRSILATTDKEFNDFIAHNQPFVERCTKMTFKELPDDQSKKILEDKVELDVDRVIEVDADAYDALLTVAKADTKRSNPRKVIDIHKDVRSFVYSWEPKKLRQQLDQQINDKDDLEAQCITANNNDPLWSNSSEGIKMLEDLKNKVTKIEELTEELKTQKSDLGRIARLRKLAPQYRKQYNEVVHQVIAEKDLATKDELLKEFLYLKHVLRPALQSTLEFSAKNLSKDYKEELPLKIDAALIEKLYPKSSSQDSSTTATISSTETLTV